MAEIRILVCDVCGREIKDGVILTNSNRRRVNGLVPDRAAFRFDICDRCFIKIKRECRKEAKQNDDARTM